MRPTWRPDTHAEQDPVRSAVLRYLASGVVSVLLISILGVYFFRSLGHDEAIRDAKDVTRVTARAAVEPALTDAVLRGDHKALAKLDAAVRKNVLHDSSVARVKIWDRSGRIVYSDEPRLIGARYPLSPGDLAEFHGSQVDASVSDLSKPENRYERPFGKLLEVYMPLTTTSGRPLRYEEYYRFSFVTARERRIFREFAFIMLGALILLGLFQFPLAWRLAHRVREGQRDRANLLQRAVDASETERRRIAADLHDGVVQNLAGVSYALSAAATSAPPELATTLRDAATQTRQGIRALRTLLVEIYPAELQREGLEAALHDLLAPAAASGLETHLEVDTDGELPPAVQAIFFRAAQEALRNVVKHADAHQVNVAVERLNGRVTLRIEDDGSGFEPAHGPDGAHFGLRVLRDLVRDVGGDLEIDSGPGRGTAMRVELDL